MGEGTTAAIAHALVLSVAACSQGPEAAKRRAGSPGSAGGGTTSATLGPGAKARGSAGSVPTPPHIELAPRPSSNTTGGNPTHAFISVATKAGVTLALSRVEYLPEAGAAQTLKRTGLAREGGAGSVGDRVELPPGEHRLRVEFAAPAASKSAKVYRFRVTVVTPDGRSRKVVTRVGRATRLPTLDR